MKKAMIILIIICTLLIGCSAKDKTMEKGIEAQTSGDADVSTKSNGDTNVKVETDDGTVEINSKNSDEWCQKGSEYSSTSSDGTANMEVLGVETSGKYAGYCHIRSQVVSQDGRVDVDYYYDKDDNGYQVMEVNGQKFESEWTNE